MLTYHDVLKLSYDTDLSAVIMEWTGFSNKEQFREANEAVLQLLKNTSAKKILADVRHMKIISLQDQQWLYQEWFPRVTKAGLAYAAIVESEDFFNRLTVDNIVQKVNDQLTVKYFDTLLGARFWLKSL